MKKLIVLAVFGLVAMVGPKEACAASLIERFAAPIETLKATPTMAPNMTPILSYGRTFQKSGSKNRAVAIMPFIEWGILDAVVAGGTPGFGEGKDLLDEKGILGAGGGVAVNRVLFAMFPETGSFFQGPIPYTGGKVTWEFKFGAGLVWDFAADEPAQLIYAGPQIAF